MSWSDEDLSQFPEFSLAALAYLSPAINICPIPAVAPFLQERVCLELLYASIHIAAAGGLYANDTCLLVPEENNIPHVKKVMACLRPRVKLLSHLCVVPLLAEEL